MLVLSRKAEESVILCGNIEVKVLGIRGDQVSLGFQAPHDVSIYRSEVYEAIAEENRKAGYHGEQELISISKQLEKKLSPSAVDPPSSAESA
jgi:carbon storage regulator